VDGPNGELGNGIAGNSSSVGVKVMKEDGEPLSQVIAIFSERGDHTWALTKKGDIYCWGSNKRG